MAKKEYKNGGTRKFIVDSTGYKRDRKEANKRDLEYKKKTYRQIAIRIRKDDTEILEKLNNVPNKTDYILDLIRKDINRKD